MSDCRQVGVHVHARETKVGRKTFFRQLSHRNAAFLPFSLQFFCVFLHRRRWRSLPAAPDPIPKSESATMNRENKAVAASESSEAAGPKRAFQLVESRSCCRRNTWDGREKERRIGSGETKVEMKNQIPLKDGKNIAAAAAASGGSGEG